MAAGFKENLASLFFMKSCLGLIEWL